jgi:hypothetical protein
MSTGTGTGSPILGVSGGVGSVLPIAVSGLSRGDYREDIARMFGFVKSVATAGATTTLTDPTLLRYPNDYFNGAQIWISEADGAAPEDEDSYISDFVNATGVLTFSPAMSAAVQSGDHYHLFMTVTKDAIDEAIARASQGAEAIYQLTIDTDTLDYDLTYVTGLRDTRQIRCVMVRSADDELTQPYLLRDFYVEDNFGQLTLRLMGSPNSNDRMWIVYQLDDTGMQDDAQRCNLPTDLILARAKCYLLQDLLPRQDQSGMDKYGQLLRYWDEERQKLERKYQPKSSKVKKAPWQTLVAGGATITQAERALGLYWKG